MKITYNTVYEVLEKYFGYKTLKPVQEEIINEIISGKNVLAILPTGAGKSICYQIPAILSNNFSIVISPLIALMKDQVDSLNKKEKIASFINSSLNDIEIENVFLEIQNGVVKILYLSPEKLQNNLFTERIKNLSPTFIFVDEAHCVSEWGHNFRPSYLKIKDFIEYCKIQKVSAFTATATEEVRNDIIKLLAIENPRIFIKGFERTNLSLNVFPNVEKKAKLLEILSSNQKPALVYTSTRKYCEDISEFLNKNGIKSTYYHAGLSSEIKRIVQDDFIMNRTNVIIATNAFGMGIDKNNIRTIIHYNMPGSIENYYQEIGRAGRDNLESKIFLFYDKKDKDIQEFFIDSSYPTRNQIELVYEAICDYGNVALGFINNKPILLDNNLKSLFELKDLNNAIVESSLNVLTNSHYINYQNQFQKDFYVKIIINKTQLYDFIKNEFSQGQKELVALLIKKYSKIIFEKKNKIIIENLAYELETNTVKIISLLEQLYNEGIIDLTMPSKFQTISLIKPRVRSADLILDMEKVHTIYNHFKYKLDKMIDFVFTDTCRMKFIINYFGQDDDNYKCNKCDNCLKIYSTSKSSSNYLEEIILRTLQEFHQPVKVHLLIKILKGSVSNSLKKISTFGTCEHFTNKELELIIDELVAKKIIIKHEDTIKISNKALDIILDLDEDIHQETNDFEKDLELYNKLRNIRTEASEKFNQPTKIICPDEVLLKISKIKPTTPSELLSIDGFNQRMFNKIGELFLNEINNFEKDKDKFLTTLIELINKNYTFDEIVSLTKIPETVLSLKIISMIESYKKINYKNLISKNEFEKVKEKFNNGVFDLKELFSQLDKKISYNKIKIILKILTS